MRNERQVLRNTAILAGGEALGQCANLLFVVAFARTYGPAVMGHYSLGMAIGAVAGLAVSLGTQSFLVRELAQAPALAGSRVAALAPWQAWSVLLTGAVVAGMLWSHGTGFWVMLAAVGYQLVHRAAGLYFVAHRATERMSVAVLADVAQRCATLVLGGLLMIAGAGAGLTAAVMLVSALGLAIAGRALMQRDFGALPRVPLRAAWPVLRDSWPFFGTLVLAVLYARGAPILLGMQRGAEAVGSYAVADRLVVVATLIPTMYANAALPALSRLMRQDATEARRLATRLLRILLLLALPLAAAIISFAADLVELVFGPSYRDAVPLLQILALAMPLQCLEQMLGAQLAAAGQQRLLLRSRLVSLGAFLFAGPQLVNAAGATGLTVTVVGCSLLQLAGTVYGLRRMGPLPLRWVGLLPPTLAAIAAATTALLLTGLPLMLRGAAFALTFAIIGWSVGAMRSHDFRFALAMLRPAQRDSGPAA